MRKFRMKRSVSGLLLLLIACAPAVALPHAAIVPHDNATVARLETQDQADRSPGPNGIDWNVVDRHDAKRRAVMLQLMKAGDIRTANDYLDAAVIFQHGPSLADTRLALALATLSHRLDPPNQQAGLLLAQTWDRMLERMGRPQWYGTQYVRANAHAPWHLYRVDPTAVTDAQRKALGLPTLAQARARVRLLNGH